MYGTLPLAVPVVYRQLMREVYWSDAPVGYRPIQSVDVGEPMPLQVAVTVPPAATLDGVTETVAGGKPTPVTERLASPPPVNVTLFTKLLADVGVKRTVTFWLCPADRL